MLKGVLVKYFQKNRFYKFLKTNKYLLLFGLIVLIYLLTRFLWLDRFPGGMDADQMEVSLSSLTIRKFSVDSSGTPWYRMIFGNNTKAGIAGLPSIVFSLFNFPFNNALIEARIPYVLVNILSLLILSLFVYEVTENKKLSYIVFAVGVVNPWFFSYSRLPTEAPFSLFTLLLGLYLWVKYKENNFYYSLIPFVICFYSYYGAKPILILLIPLLVFLRFRSDGSKVFKKSIYYLLIFFSFIFLSFGLSKIGSTATLANRTQNEIIFFNPDSFSPQVDEYRRALVANPASNLIANKYSFMFSEFLRKYTSYISSDILFWKGDSRGIYTFQDHGLFYIVDILFIIFGIIGVSKHKDLSNILGLLFVIAPIPTALSLNGDSFYYRGFLLIPSFVVLISLGIWYLFERTSEKYKPLLAIGMALVYSISWFNFLGFYFFRYPVKQHANNFLEGRLISDYIKRTPNTKITVVTTSPYSVFNDFIFYSKAIDTENNVSLSKEKTMYEIGLVKIINTCVQLDKDGIYIIDARLNCNDFGLNYKVFQNQSDAGVTFKIYNDTLCSNKYTLENYRRNHYILDYNIEALSEQSFCNRWIQNGKDN